MSLTLKTIGSFTSLVGNTIVGCESILYRSIDYVAPVFLAIKSIESLCPVIDITPRRSTSPRSNRRCKKSSGGSKVGHMNARNRRNSKATIIIPGPEYYHSKHVPRPKPSSSPSSVPSSEPSPEPRSIPSPVSLLRSILQYLGIQRSDPSPVPSPDPSPVPNIDPSSVPPDPKSEPDSDPSPEPTNDSTYDTSTMTEYYHDNDWYDATAPLWTGGLFWKGAYVLNHQVVSITTDPVFVSNLLPENELSPTLNHKEVRSVGSKVGPRATIALDSASSIHLFKDAFLLNNITTNNKQKLKVRTTDSTFYVKDIGDLCEDLKSLPLPSDGYYYYPGGVANILSLAIMAKTKRVVMDTAIENAFYVFNDDGSYIKFIPSSNGMYCLDIGAEGEQAQVMAVQTVEDEKAKYSRIDCTRAEAIRKLQQVLACPSDVDLANAVEHNIIGPSPFTRRDVHIAKKIYGPDVPSLKGKTVKRQSKMPREDEMSDLPPYIDKEYRDVYLSVDVMHVNGIMFLISFSKHIGLIQTYCIRRNNKEKFLGGILSMLRLYRSRHPFRVVNIEADGAFESIREDLQDPPYQVGLTTCDADRHVETIERQIRHIKERIRSVRMMLPYKKLPKRFIIELVHRVGLLINSLPKKGGIHRIISPRELVTGKKFRLPEHQVG